MNQDNDVLGYMVLLVVVGSRTTMDDAVRNKFYPELSVLPADINLFWSRGLIMAGLEVHWENPLQGCLFHRHQSATNRGRKMSKSLGNSQTPWIFIAKYGADGLRFGVIRVAPQGSGYPFRRESRSEEEGTCHKLWNAVRFREMQGPCNPEPNLLGLEHPDIAIHLLSRFDAMHEALKEANAGTVSTR